MSFKEAGARMIARLEAFDLALKKELFTRILTGTPVDTGEARGGWTISIDHPTAIADGNLDPSCVEGLSLIAAMGREHVGAVSVYSNAVGHIMELEYGKSQQAPYGMVRINIAAFEQIARSVARRL